MAKYIPSQSAMKKNPFTRLSIPGHLKKNFYRPISLLNLKLKLFTNILITRILPYISDLINWDQVGFVPGREVKDATIRGINGNTTSPGC